MKSSPEATALKVFVVLLFSLCFAIVLVAHILYNQHIGEVTIIVGCYRKTKMYNGSSNYRLGFSRRFG